jgi:hypothetical protein
MDFNGIIKINNTIKIFSLFFIHKWLLVTNLATTC